MQANPAPRSNPCFITSDPTPSCSRPLPCLHVSVNRSIVTLPSGQRVSSCYRHFPGTTCRSLPQHCVTQRWGGERISQLLHRVQIGTCDLASSHGCKIPNNIFHALSVLGIYGVWMGRVSPSNNDIRALKHTRGAGTCNSTLRSFSFRKG